MDRSIMQAFADSTSRVFSTALGAGVTESEADAPTSTGGTTVTGVIGLSGAASGILLVRMPAETALNATGAMLGVRPTSCDADMIDAVGELTNMIAGGAKGLLAPMFSHLAIPLVVVGAGQTIVPLCQNPAKLSLESTLGPLLLEVEVNQLDGVNHRAKDQLAASAI